MTTFYVQENNLEDGSFTYDVMLSVDGELVLFASPANQRIAEEMVDAFNRIRRGFALINEHDPRGYTASKFTDELTLVFGGLLRSLPAK